MVYAAGEDSTSGTKWVALEEMRNIDRDCVYRPYTLADIGERIQIVYKINTIDHAFRKSSRSVPLSRVIVGGEGAYWRLNNLLSWRIDEASLTILAPRNREVPLEVAYCSDLQRPLSELHPSLAGASIVEGSVTLRMPIEGPWQLVQAPPAFFSLLDESIKIGMLRSLNGAKPFIVYSPRAGTKEEIGKGEAPPPSINVRLTREIIAPEADELALVLAEINDLVGMEQVKQEVHELTNFLKVQRIRASRGLAPRALSLHAVFLGPPGTGKTTVARLLGKIYKYLGLLAKGHVTETDRAGLVAGYVGQSALQVDAVVNAALDGVLFIDEAYSLRPSHSSDFGHEVLSTLLSRMENHRDRLAVILAGYEDEMETFLHANPGLKSRFNRYFHFSHYTPAQLLAIFQRFCRDDRLLLTEGAKTNLSALLAALHDRRDKSFGNGRLVRNLLERIVQRQADRIADLQDVTVTDEELATIETEDVSSAAQDFSDRPLRAFDG